MKGKGDVIYDIRMMYVVLSVLYPQLPPPVLAPKEVKPTQALLHGLCVGGPLQLVIQLHSQILV